MEEQEQDPTMIDPKKLTLAGWLWILSSSIIALIGGIWAAINAPHLGLPRRYELGWYVFGGMGPGVLFGVLGYALLSWFNIRIFRQQEKKAFGEGGGPGEAAKRVLGEAVFGEDEPMDEPPFDGRIDCVLETHLSAEQVAGLHSCRGWRVRKSSSWTDYELRSAWADLALDCGTELLLHGSLADPLGRANELLAPLRDAGVRYKGEFYGAKGELLQAFKG